MMYARCTLSTRGAERVHGNVSVFNERYLAKNISFRGVLSDYIKKVSQIPANMQNRVNISYKETALNKL